MSENSPGSQNPHANKRLVALVIGATGATGSSLVDQLTADDEFSEVKIFVRRPSGLQHSKLRKYVVDFENMELWKSHIEGDVAFSCLGTTLKSAGSKQAQKRIDLDYQYEFAQHARNNRVKTYVLVSAYGASSKSRIFYSRIKGELEDKVVSLGFPNCFIFQPGMLIRPNSQRLVEVWGLAILRFINQIGLLRSQKPLPTETLAQAMVHVSKSDEQGLRVFRLNEIFELVG